MQTANKTRGVAQKDKDTLFMRDQRRLSILELLSIIGSLASIIGLGIVILQEATKEYPIRHSLLGWRIALFAMALVAVSGSLVFTFVWACDAFYDQNRSDSRRILTGTLRAVAGLLLFGVCLDGLFATIYWTYWLSGPADFIKDDVIGWFYRVIAQ